MPPSSSLSDWLSYIESLHPKTIDMGLVRVHAVKEKLNLHLSCPVISVAGTNGKGSTCAMLESMLLAAGYRVACYTSPHLLRFNERARVQGISVSDEALCDQFAAVEAARGSETLTYFEFTTLAILRWFQHSTVDVAILEVGMGGRLDAVNSIDADCSIVTSIDLDHVEYLGATREQIGFEKAHIYRANKPAICCDPNPPLSLLGYAQAINADLRCFGRDFHYAVSTEHKQQQWSYVGRDQSRHSLAYPALRGTNQLLNACGALAALEALQNELPVSQQAVRQGLGRVELPGRFQVLPGRPTVILDVAHNPHAAAVLVHNLDSMGFYANTYAVFGMLKDKDIAGVVRHLSGQIDHWHLATLPGARGTRAEFLANILAEQNIVTAAPEPSKGFHGRSVHCHASPAAAYAAVKKIAQENDRILVFGSFHTVSNALAID